METQQQLLEASNNVRFATTDLATLFCRASKPKMRLASEIAYQPSM